MALSFIAAPDPRHPAYNPVVYYVDSTNKNQPAFRYVVQIYRAGTAVLVAELKIAPSPGTGYGYIDISKICQTQVSGNLQVNNTTWYGSDAGTCFNYDIKFGEEFISTWTFNDYEYNATPAFLGKTNLRNFSSIPHGYAVGDQIRVNLTQVYNNFRDAVNGFWTVLAVPTASTVTINLNYPGAGPLTPGTAQYADGRKTRLLNLISKLNQVAFNRAYSFEENRFYEQSLLLPGASGQIQTSAPDTGYRLHTWQPLWWNFFDNKSNDIQRVYFTNDAGEQFYKNVGSALYFMKTIAVGPANTGLLTPVAPATLPLIKPTTQYYDVQAFDVTGATAQTNSKRIYIDTRCPINQTQLLFLDRAGSYSTLPFTLRQTRQQQITRQEWRQELGGLNEGIFPSQWGYAVTDAGNSILNVEQTELFTLQSDWFTTEMSQYQAELMSSPDVLVQFDGSTDWRRCIITDTNYEIQTQKNKRLIRSSVTIKLAVDDAVNI